jgi:hypothetical protein
MATVAGSYGTRRAVWNDSSCGWSAVLVAEVEMKRIKVIGSKARRIRVVHKTPPKHIDPELVEKALGAERVTDPEWIQRLPRRLPV